MSVKLSCISSSIFTRYPQLIVRRLLSTNIAAPIPGSEFFNREREIAAFKEIFSHTPQLTIVSGPVNSGKTSLLLKIFQEISEHQPILHLDLRERSFASVNEFQSVLSEEMPSWLEKVEKQAREGFGLKLPTSKETEKKVPIERLNSLFQSVSQHLPNHSRLLGKRTPVLFIDEASRLNSLLRDPEGHEALVNMFQWFVKSAKQSHQFHVVLASSDSFFPLWVTKFVGSSRSKCYVIGDLSRDESKKFWEEKIVVKLNRPDIEKPPFESAYSVCGGNMFLLSHYIKDYLIAEGKFEPKNFFLVRQERTRLVRAIWKDLGQIGALTSQDSKPEWSKDQLYQMMELLVKSPDGFLEYENLCVTMTQKVVDSFIHYKILHLRSSKEFAWDIPNAPIERAIVTAETPSAIEAMRQLLNESSQNVINPRYQQVTKIS